MDDRFPTKKEQALLGRGIFISKTKYSDENIHPTYHKWRDIWDDQLSFRIKNADENYVLRAIAITIPMYFVDDPMIKEFTYTGYVAGLVFSEYTKEGNIHIFPINDIVWL